MPNSTPHTIDTVIKSLKDRLLSKQEILEKLSLGLKNGFHFSNVSIYLIDADTEKSNCANVFTERPLSGEIDAVAEPLDIKVAVNAGKLNNPLPSPTNNDADILPLISTLPVNSEPLNADSTLKPY